MKVARRAFLRMGYAALMLGMVERYVPDVAPRGWVASAPLPENVVEFAEWNRQVLQQMARVHALPYAVLIADPPHTHHEARGN